MNTLIGVRLPEIYDQDETAAELLECTLRSKLPVVLKAACSDVGTAAEKSD